MSIAPHWAFIQLASLAVLFLLFWGSSSLKTASFVGFFFGLGWFCTVISWIYISIHDYGHQPFWIAGTGTFVFAAVLALFPTLVGFMAASWKVIKNNDNEWLFFIFLCPALWTFTEWLRSWVFTGLPWGAGSYAHIESPLAAYAPIIGGTGIGYLAALIAGLACCFIVAIFRSKLKVVCISALVIAIILCGAYPLNKITWSHPGPAVQFRLLQGGVDQDEKFSPQGFAKSYSFYLDEMKMPGLTKGDVVVLPETIFPFPVLVKKDSPEKSFIEFARNNDIDVIFGGFVLTEPHRYSNAAILAKDDGRTKKYYKKHLVPFGEYVPFGFHWFINMLGIPMGDLIAGDDDQPLFEVNGVYLAPTLCFEDLFPNALRDWWQDDKSPGILVNLSNLGWFGDSAALPQHLGISRMRAIEFARPMVRATNTGVTAAIDAKGKVLAQLPYMLPGCLDIKVESATGKPTIYVRFGDWPTIIWVILVLIAMAFVSKKREQRYSWR